MISKLQYISQGETVQEHIENSIAAIYAGCDWIQLRLKGISDLAYMRAAMPLKAACDRNDVWLIINDNPKVAKMVGADGLHLGKEDICPKVARKILGDNCIIGGTANTIEDIRGLKRKKVDYIGLGPFRFTATKKKLSPILGLEGYSRIISQMNAENIDIPVVAIGGILLEDVGEIMKTGVHGIAVSGLITTATDKKGLIDQLWEAVNKSPIS